MNVMIAVALAVVARPVRADIVASEAARIESSRIDDSARHRRRIIAVVTGSVGAASIAIGVAHGIGAAANWHDFKSGPGEPCDSALVCNDAGARQIDRAKGLARGADILIGSGLAVVGIAAAIWWTAPEPRVVPIVGSAPGAAITGRF